MEFHKDWLYLLGTISMARKEIFFEVPLNIVRIFISINGK
jgi:hypothetical protein